MPKKKVIQSLYSGLGGHASVAFSLLNSDFGKINENFLVFYGIEKTPTSYVEKLNKNSVKFEYIIKKPKQYLRPLLKFYKIIKREKPNVIIIHNSELIIPAYFYKKNNNVKIVFVEHEPNHIKNKINWFLSRYALKRADTVVCLNTNYKMELLNKYSNTAQVKVIPNGINTSDFKRYKEITSCRTLGIAARITKTKDHKNLIKAFSDLKATHPNLCLKIAGSGELEDEIKNLIKSLHLENNVEMLGMLDENNMVKFLNEIDLYVHATLSETLSTSILQAMACELPVITSDIKNNKLLIDEGETGYFYENKNSESLYKVMKHSVENFDEAVKIGKAARKKVVEQYSNQIMGEGYIKLSESL